MRKLTVCLVTICFFLCSGCVRVPYPDETDANLNPWTLVEDLVPEQAILNSYAAINSNALYLVTNDEFIRLSTENNVLEKRSLDGNFSKFYTPVISDNLFVRAVEKSGITSLEFHLTKSNDFWPVKINEEDLGLAPGEFVELESSGLKELGGFNPDGSKFMIAVSNPVKNLHSFIVFQIFLDASTTEIRHLRVETKIDIPEIPTDFDQVKSIRFFNDHWYVATKVGAFKIDKDGGYELLRQGWYLDAFRRNGKIYITAYDEFDMLISDDNGQTWETTQTRSPLNFVSVAGAKLVSQTAKGKAFQTPLEETNIFELGDMRLNRNMFESQYVGSFSSFDYFNQKFYMAAGKELYFAEEVLLEQ